MDYGKLVITAPENEGVIIETPNGIINILNRGSVGKNRFKMFISAPKEMKIKRTEVVAKEKVMRERVLMPSELPAVVRYMELRDKIKRSHLQITDEEFREMNTLGKMYNDIDWCREWTVLVNQINYNIGGINEQHP